MSETQPPAATERGSWTEVFAAFLVLGLTSFGGPVAHIGYFRRAFVARRAWLSEAALAELVALCQFLPGPASSQLGFAIGLKRAGAAGAAAAFAGFTLPSAAAMTVFALSAGALPQPWAGGLTHGLTLVAAAVVFQAVTGMSRTLAPDAPRAALALAAAAWAAFAPAALAQSGAIAAGAVIGALLMARGADTAATAVELPSVSPRAGLASLALFLAILFGAPLLAGALHAPLLARFDAYYRSGALVFGGGHVVLPLLQQALVDPGWVERGRFLAGYGAAQAVPGPLFTFAAFLGATMTPPGGGVAGAALGLAGIFLPGFLVLIAALPFWRAIRRSPRASGAVRGAGAAVVGVLGAAFIHPVLTSAVRDGADAAAALACAGLLMALRWPPIAVVAAGAAFGLARPTLGL